MISKRKGQSTMEYALIIAVVAAALLAVNIFMKRGLENRLRRSTDDIAKQFDANKTAMTRLITRTGGSTYEYTDYNGTRVHGGFYDTGSGENGTRETTAINATEHISEW